MKQGHKLAALIERLQKSGVGVSKGSELAPTRWVPSGSLLLDAAIGGRGYPRSKFIHIYGKDSSGKSLLADACAALVTRQQRTVLYCDLENSKGEAETRQFRHSLGVDPEYMIDIDGHQDAQTVLDASVDILSAAQDQIPLMIVDSIGAFSTKKGQEKDLSDGEIDEVPRLVGRFCRKLNVVNKHTAIILLAHAVADFGFGYREYKSSGGNKLAHWGSVRLHVKGHLLPQREDGKKTVHQMTVEVEKNKIAMPGGQAKDLRFDLLGSGFDTLDELIELAKMRNVITSAGAYLHLTEHKEYKAQGKAGFRQLLEDTPQMFGWLFQQTTGFEVEEYYRVS